MEHLAERFELRGDLGQERLATGQFGFLKVFANEGGDGIDDKETNVAGNHELLEMLKPGRTREVLTEENKEEGG